MRVSALTAGLFLALSGVALADGCGDACECPKPQPHHSVTTLPAHPVMSVPAVHHAARLRPRMAAAYYNYGAEGEVRQGYGHSAWRVAPNDGQVPMMGPVIEAMPGPCCAPAPLPQPMAGPCCAPVMYGPPVAYGPPPGYYNPAQDPSAYIDDKGWTGGVGYNPEGGGGGGGGDYGQVHFANGGSAQNGPTYNDYNQSFQSNPSVPGAFQNRLMGGLAPATTSSSK